MVATTRTGRRLEDQPTRVEVLDREEIEEKLLMTPGDIVMMLNEMGGLRVQATSPSIGAASVRDPGHARPLHALSRPTACRSSASRSAGSGCCRFRRWISARSRSSRARPRRSTAPARWAASSTCCRDGRGRAGARAAVQPVDARRHRRRRLSVGAAQRSHGARRCWPAGIGRSRNDRRRRRLGRCRRLRARRRPAAGVLGRRQRTLGVSHRRHHRSRIGKAARCPARCSRRPARRTSRRSTPGGSTSAPAVRRCSAGASSRPRGPRRRGSVTIIASATVRERDAHDTLFGEAALRGAAGRAHLGRRRRRRTRPLRPARRAATSPIPYVVPGLFVQDDIDLASWLSVSGQSARRLPQRVRHVRQPAPGRADARRRLDQPRLGRPRVLRGHAADRGDRGRRTDAADRRGTARGRARPTASFDLDARLRPGDGHGRRCSRRASTIRSTSIATTRYVLAHADRRHHQRRRGAARHLRRRPFAATGTYTYVQSREHDRGLRQDVALTPRHSVGVVGMWEADDVGRVGLEVYYTGPPAARGQSVSHESRPYVICRPAGRDAVRTVPRLRQRREPDRRAPDAVGSARAAVTGRRRPLDRRRLGAARRPGDQRRRARRVLSAQARAGAGRSRVGCVRRSTGDSRR